MTALIFAPVRCLGENRYLQNLLSVCLAFLFSFSLFGASTPCDFNIYRIYHTNDGSTIGYYTRCNIHGEGTQANQTGLVRNGWCLCHSPQRQISTAVYKHLGALSAFSDKTEGANFWTNLLNDPDNPYIEKMIDWSDSSNGLPSYKDTGTLLFDSSGNPIGMMVYDSNGEIVVSSGSVDSSGQYVVNGYTADGKVGKYKIILPSSYNSDVEYIGEFSLNTVSSPSGRNIVSSVTSSFLGIPQSGTIVYNLDGSPSTVTGFNSNGQRVNYVLTSSGSASSPSFTASGYDSSGSPVVYNVTYDNTQNSWITTTQNADLISFSESEFSSTSLSQKYNLDQSKGIQSFTASDGSSFNVDFSELIKGQQSILDCLTNGSDIPEDIETDVTSLIPSTDEISTLEEEVSSSFSDTPYQSDFDLANIHKSADIGFLNNTISSIFGSLPSIGQTEFSNSFEISCGDFSFPVQIDLSMFPLSSYRSAFAFIIMFLGAVASVRVVGGAFE